MATVEAGDSRRSTWCSTLSPAHSKVVVVADSGYDVIVTWPAAGARAPRLAAAAGDVTAAAAAAVGRRYILNGTSQDNLNRTVLVIVLIHLDSEICPGTKK